MSIKTARQRISAITTAIIMGSFGVTAFASADTIDTTGPNSTNTITTTEENKCIIKNDNDVEIKQENRQEATTGDAVVTNNTTAGSAQTGDAINENTAEFIVEISNDSAFIGPVHGALVAPIALAQPLFDECGNPIHLIPGMGGGISTTGPGSSNSINYGSNYSKHRVNKNRAGVGFRNVQGAGSGGGYSNGNTSGGGAGAGPARNYNAPAAAVAVANAPAGGAGGGGGGAAVAPKAASISNTGPSSDNSISSTTSNDTRITNNNNVSVNSSNQQYSSSGDATVANNTTAGGAGTGDAANVNDTYGSVGIAN